MLNADDRPRQVPGRRVIWITGLVLVVGVVGFVLSNVGVTEQPPKQAKSDSKAVLTPATIPADWAVAAKANGQFAVELYQQLAKQSAQENIFLSPFSISTVLTMVAEGAVDQTRDQMADVLHVPHGNLEPIHRGQHGLQSVLVPQIPPGARERIADLRAKLKKTNEQTVALGATEKRQETYLSQREAQKLANEINELTRQISAYDLRIANALWMEKSRPVLPEFLSAVTPYYGAVVFPADFKTRPDSVRLEINDWVARQTNDRIQDLVPPNGITEQMRLLVTNSVYFKGDWAKPFEAKETRPERFRLSSDRSIDVPMMQQWNGESASYAAFTAIGELFPSPDEIKVELKDEDPSLYPDSQGHTMLSLDYQGQKMQMVLLVPQSAEGIHKLEKSLSYESLERWIHQLKQRTVGIHLPKFKLESRYRLNQTLESLGMSRAFETPQGEHDGAQFDRLCSTANPADRFFISEVVHRTFVDVSEVGTEAAAATYVSMEVSDGQFDTRPFIPVFKANKPFLFLIRERETGTILFLGRYISPGPNPAEASEASPLD